MQMNLMDAVFVDVFRYFSGPEGYASLSVASLTEVSHCRIRVDTYDVKIMATSERGEMAINGYSGHGVHSTC